MTELMRRRRALMGQKITDDAWDDVFRAVDGGTYAADYTAGDIIPLIIDGEGAINAQIVAFNADSKADGSGNAPITFICEHLLNADHRFNPARSGESPNYVEGTGYILGWKESELRTYVAAMLSKFPIKVASRIVPVIKYTKWFTSSFTTVASGQTTDYLWVPSSREIYHVSYAEGAGPMYNYFSDNDRRSKSKVDGIYSKWWLRTGAGSNNGCIVTGGGGASYVAPNVAEGIAIGFCIG